MQTMTKLTEKGHHLRVRQERAGTVGARSKVTHQISNRLMQKTRHIALELSLSHNIPGALGAMHTFDCSPNAKRRLVNGPIT